MPDVISFFEHQAIPYNQIHNFPTDPAARESILQQIERINQSAGLEILHLGRKEIRANALVGIVRAGSFTFEILPKIDWDAKDQPEMLRKSAVKNLLVMLSYVSQIKIYEQDTAGLEDQVGTWFEFLTRLFAQDLHRQILSGLAQQYISNEETLPVLRGRWNIQKQITLHSQNCHRFDVLYDVLSSDIPLNQVLRFVVELLARLTQDPENKALLGDISRFLRPISLLPEITSTLLDSVHFNRLNNRFQSAYQLARLFLSGKSIQLTAGRIPAYALVFDMNVLFERFVIACIRNYQENILPQTWQPAVIIEQSAGRNLFLGYSQGKPVFRLRPDLILQRQQQSTPLLIADMKYKIIDFTRRSLGAIQLDIYQMLAYAIQSGCARGLLVYPQPAGTEPVRQDISINHARMKLFIATFNLHVSLQKPENLIQELHEILKSCAE